LTQIPIQGILTLLQDHSTCFGYSPYDLCYVRPVAVNCSYCTPDDGHGKYPKHVEWSCNKIKILVWHLVGHFLCVCLCVCVCVCVCVYIYIEKYARNHEPKIRQSRATQSEWLKMSLNICEVGLIPVKKIPVCPTSNYAVSFKIFKCYTFIPSLHNIVHTHSYTRYWAERGISVSMQISWNTCYIIDRF
jgi:hypothetical protein